MSDRPEPNLPPYLQDSLASLSNDEFLSSLPTPPGSPTPPEPPTPSTHPVPPTPTGSPTQPSTPWSSTSSRSPVNPKRVSWQVWLLTAAGSALIISAVMRVLTPYQAPTPISASPRPNLDNSFTSFSSVSYVGAAPNLPTELSVGEINIHDSNLTSLKDKLISKYKLSPANVANVWSGDDGYLQKSANSDEYTFGFSDKVLSRSQTEEEVVLSPEKINEIGRNFLLSLLGEDYDLQAIENQVSTFDGLEGGGDQSPQNQFSLVPYSLIVDGYPLYYRSSNVVPFHVTVSRTGQIVKFDLRPQLLKVSQLNKVTPITLDQALSQIRNGVGTVVDAGKDSFGPLKLNSLSQVELETLSVEYRLDEANRKLVPFYRFSGTALNSLKEKIRVEVITPAVPVVFK